MIEPSAKLAENIFDSPAQAPTRNGFGDGLVEAAEGDDRIVALCADLTESTRMEAFAKKYPERFVEMGVAEQNLATVASGMAAYGKIPFIASYATFSPGRNWEQIRTTISLNNVPVVIVGSHAGVSVGPDGATHQALEDMALMRVQPNMTVISPCDSEEARKATLAAAKCPGPVYLRLAREKTPVFTTRETPFTIGKAEIFWRAPASEQQKASSEPKNSVAIFATGPLLHNALLSARELEKESIAATVVNVHTIKPLDEDRIVRIAREAGAVVTVEEHQVAGGLGGAIAELLARESPTPIEFIGVHDQFGQSGKPEELIAHYHLDAPSITEAAKKAVGRRN
ncbi:MAG: transketolase family protein [Patescibacteria group bacterium]|nr:transketolase family protein [Patescibacteria group bacterium]